MKDNKYKDICSQTNFNDPNIFSDAPILTETLQPATELIFGKSAYLACSAHGVPEPKFAWYIDDKPIFTMQNHTVNSTVNTINARWSVVSTLEIDVVNGSQDQATYSCAASNEIGKSESKTKVTVGKSAHGPF